MYVDDVRVYCFNVNRLVLYYCFEKHTASRLYKELSHQVTLVIHFRQVRLHRKQLSASIKNILCNDRRAKRVNRPI